MATFAQPAFFLQPFQTVLPLALSERLHRVRSRYAAALLAAGKGDYTPLRELRCVSRYLGHVLAEQARLSPEERGGLRLLDVTLAVDRLFPEMRGFTQYELLQSHRRRILAQEKAC
jgi:hypothetical protein